MANHADSKYLVSETDIALAMAMAEENERLKKENESLKSDLGKATKWMRIQKVKDSKIREGLYHPHITDAQFVAGMKRSFKPITAAAVTLAVIEAENEASLHAAAVAAAAAAARIEREDPMARLEREDPTPKEGVFGFALGKITPIKLAIAAREWLDENGGWLLLKTHPETITKISGGVVNFCPDTDEQAEMAFMLAEVAMNYMSSPDTKENIDLRTCCAHRLCRMSKLPMASHLEFVFKAVDTLAKQGVLVRFSAAKAPGGPAIKA